MLASLIKVPSWIGHLQANDGNDCGTRDSTWPTCVSFSGAYYGVGGVHAVLKHHRVFFELGLKYAYSPGSSYDVAITAVRPRERTKPCGWDLDMAKSLVLIQPIRVIVKGIGGYWLSAFFLVRI